MLYQNGLLNTTALTVPDIYVDIVPPQNLIINGVPSNILGVVGVASWGPVNKAVIVGGTTEYVANFGAIGNRTFDAGTAVAIAQQQGANDFRVVRVTDGTDSAATGTLGALNLTAAYTGSFGNGIAASIVAGSKSSSWTVVITAPNKSPEAFTNITGTGATFWQNAASAINNGTGPARGASGLVTATVNTANDTTAPAAESAALTGGTDGTTSVTATTLIGSDTEPRAGMYALRGAGTQVAMLADATDNTTWTDQVAFGLQEGTYMIAAGPAGETISSATSNKQTAGIDSYGMKVMLGDWCWWYDQANQINRLVSPQAFAAGRLVALAPNQSSLNKQLYGIIGSQKVGTPGTTQAGTYSTADLQALAEAGIDVITNPAPGGHYWAVRIGHNSSSNPVANGDAYTRMTNYLADTLNNAMGVYVGQTVSPSLFRRITATLGSFLANLLQQKLLAPLPNGADPFTIVCNASNNPQSRTALGYVQADVAIEYEAINEKFLVNLQGGASVQVTRAGA